MAASRPVRHVAVLAFTRRGARLGALVSATLGPGATLHVARRWHEEAPPDAQPIDGSTSAHVATLFGQVDALVMVLAVGAVVRLVAPLLSNKQDDPAILAIDETGRYVVPVAGGHQAGANALATEIGAIVGGEAVITTASDVLGLPALDVLGRDEGWKVEASPEITRQVMAAAIDGAMLGIYQDVGTPRPLAALPDSWPRLGTEAALLDWNGPALVVTDRRIEPPDGVAWIVYRPPSLVLGVGCSLGAPTNEIEGLAQSALDAAGLTVASIGVVATIERRRDEPGVVALAKVLGVPLETFTAEQLAGVHDLPSPSAQVARHVGTPGVCEPAAMLASAGGDLVVAKTKSAHATVAVARRRRSGRPGRLVLIGLGPGALDLMVPRARQALIDADVVVGYRAYLNSIRSIVAASRRCAYELGQERERAGEAIRLASDGASVALVSSGDVGVYGMAGLVFELLGEHDGSGNAVLPEVEVVPGVTAASAAGALLGAPLMLDFAAISLSDLLVPWPTIERRLVAVAEGDITLVLYNPASQRRRSGIERAREILLRHRSAETPVGLVREAYRSDQQVSLTTLGALPLDQIDMRTVVIVGCSRTVVLDRRMVTRRGYVGASGQD